MNEEGEEFFSNAIDYCKLIESLELLDEKSIESLLVSLLNLYILALSLPETEGEAVSRVKVSVPILHLGGFENYWEVFDPYHKEEPVCASLADDFKDIYRDLKEGIVLFEQGLLNEAIAQWKLSFDIHWGSHLVDAIRALHSVNAHQNRL